jgi:Flp pilus assembly protein TadD
VNRLLLVACAAGSLLSAAASGYAQQPSLQSLPATPATSRDEDAVAQARRLIEAGRAAEAETLLRDELRKDPRSPEANAALAYCLLRENKPADALKQYTAAAALRTPTADELVNVGQAYVLLGDMADADRWTLRAIGMSPDDAEAWYSLGRIRYTEQRFGEALACLQRALTLNPGSARIENNLGLAQEGLNHTDEAIAAYRQAIAWQGAQAGPGSEQPYLNLAIALLHRGELGEAGTLLSRAVAISPNDPRILEQIGHLRLQGGDAKGAAEAFGSAVRLEPGNSGLHFLLGQAYRRLGQSEQAQEQFAEAAKLARVAPAKP